MTRLAVLDVGDGVSVVLTRGDHAAVVGCESYNSGKVISYLNSENVSKLDGSCGSDAEAGRIFVRGGYCRPVPAC